MKTTTAILLAIGLNMGMLLTVRGQDAPPATAASAAKPAASPAAAPALAVEAPAATATTATEQPVDLAAPPTTGELEESEAAEVIPVVQFEDADLLDVIRTLARQARLNFQYDPKITAATGPDGKPLPQPRVSFRLENVTARQVLEAVLQNHDMTLQWDNKTRIGRITFKQPGAPEPLLTRVVQLNFCNPTNMALLLKSALSPRAQVMADSRTSQLVLLATEKDMETVDDLISKLDTTTKQVLIEGRIFETSENPHTIKGIDWSGTLEAQNITFGNSLARGTYDYTKSKATTTAPVPGEPTTLPSGRTIPGSTTTQTTTTTGKTVDAVLNTITGNGGLSWNTDMGWTPSIGFLNADGVRAVLSFLNKQSDTELLATPRTVTLDNETAMLEVTKAYPIFQITPGSANSPAGSQIEYTNLGTILTVTPRISGNSNITLKVVPEVSNIDSKDTQTINGQINSANVYAIRKITTQVLIPSGGTLVMGGLMNDFKSKGYKKVPLLGDLPILGLAFRHEDKQRLKQNLMIFITPTILADSDFTMEARTDYLKTPLPPDSLGGLDTSWDSGRPHDWSKAKNKNNAEPSTSGSSKSSTSSKSKSK
jgi:type II secretory pathway component GspD/PulD (secretin)